MSERRYLRPSWFIREVVNPMLMRTGGQTTLAVRGRRTGEARTVPVNVLEVEDGRYLVSPRGETEWVRNLRAAGRCELRRKGSVEAFRAVEVPDADRPRIIEAYRQRWGRATNSQFKALPDPADHPVFRIEPV
jgi:deazaflavin-dependent oxidoreductase (nitroreductase family)